MNTRALTLGIGLLVVLGVLEHEVCRFNLSPPNEQPELTLGKAATGTFESKQHARRTSAMTEHVIHRRRIPVHST